MKKYIALIIAVIICLFSLTACNGTAYKDGVYYAEADEYENGWKETVEITITGGEIVKISWDAVSNNPDIPIHKKQYSKSGLYGMLAAGAVYEWCDQAKLAEDYVLEYGLDSLHINADNGVDVIAGCSVHVNKLKDLGLKCLEKAKK